MIHRHFKTIEDAKSSAEVLQQQGYVIAYVGPCLPGKDPEEKFEIEYTIGGITNYNKPKVTIITQQKLF